ncbi:lysophospholipase [Bacillus carboniphilus]|uniref:Lysophospholipase n=1 Tax=Bacillus carboniphilus TaxID=86663 RepID=A0ABY9JTL3_9BACI|nr:alpha/beta hydrolase [Bacillus carboniphilus]WLR42731.1 lysophospholipase [Bacillus carboniphilus]
MRVETFMLKSEEGKQVHAKKWLSDDGDVKAVVQLSHGMAEHIERYDEFASFLVKHGYAVYGHDHRGHGNTAESTEELGHFHDENGFSLVVEDLKRMTEIIKKDYPNKPIILMGHSMGSFVARRYIQLYGEQLSGVIISGTGGDPGLAGKVGKRLAMREAKRKGARVKSERMDKLMFGRFNQSFKPNRTDFDWLSRDHSKVDEYVNDPLCGEICSAQFYHDLLDGLLLIHREEEVKKTPKDLPIFIFSGSEDPVGQNTKGVLKVVKQLQEAGVTDLQYKFYENGRHEMLNETNRQEVFEDVLHWLDRHVNE